MSGFLKENGYENLPANPLERAQRKISAWMNGSGKERHAPIAARLQESMTRYAGVFRNEPDMTKLRGIIKELRGRFENVVIDDRSPAFNLDLVEAFEVGNLLAFSEVMVEGALARKESRGAHFRTDFPTRDDKNWLRHTLAWRTAEGVKLDHSREVVIYMDRFPPQERKY
jgi:succinate dehydrogenase / fumarate reductase flavoprotein subunit